MVALDQIVKGRKLLVLVGLSGLVESAVPLCSVWVFEGVGAVFVTDDPVVHHLIVVADGEGVSVVDRSTLPHQKVTLFVVEL